MAIRWTALSVAWLSGALQALGTTAGVQAADLGSGKRLPAEAFQKEKPPIWAGAYVGLSIDVIGNAIAIEKFGTSKRFEANTDDISASVFVGYNLQSGPWVYGVEGDFTFSGAEIKKAHPALGTITATQGNAGSIRARAGYVWDNVLVYGTAGVAFLDTKIKASTGGSASDVKTGIVLGLGAEYLFSENWTGRVEALAYGFGEDEVVLGGAKRSVANGMGTVRVGIARRF